ncbi:unnamed protein product [Closterium sp. Naga37s-1]|nr:unnamed protein product [Closterium sp. Naga37s-1]
MNRAEGTQEAGGKEGRAGKQEEERNEEDEEGSGSSSVGESVRNAIDGSGGMQGEEREGGNESEDRREHGDWEGDGREEQLAMVGAMLEGGWPGQEMSWRDAGELWPRRGKRGSGMRKEGIGGTGEAEGEGGIEVEGGGDRRRFESGAQGKAEAEGEVAEGGVADGGVSDWGKGNGEEKDGEGEGEGEGEEGVESDGLQAGRGEEGEGARIQGEREGVGGRRERVSVGRVKAGGDEEGGESGERERRDGEEEEGENGEEDEGENGEEEGEGGEQGEEVGEEEREEDGEEEGEGGKDRREGGEEEEEGREGGYEGGDYYERGGKGSEEGEGEEEKGEYEKELVEEGLGKREREGEGEGKGGLDDYDIGEEGEEEEEEEAEEEEEEEDEEGEEEEGSEGDSGDKSRWNNGRGLEGEMEEGGLGARKSSAVAGLKLKKAEGETDGEAEGEVEREAKAGLQEAENELEDDLEEAGFGAGRYGSLSGSHSMGDLGRLVDLQGVGADKEEAGEAEEEQLDDDMEEAGFGAGRGGSRSMGDFGKLIGFKGMGADEEEEEEEEERKHKSGGGKTQGRSKLKAKKEKKAGRGKEKKKERLKALWRMRHAAAAGGGGGGASEPPFEPPEPRWTADKACANVAEMGEATAGSTDVASLKLRRMIELHLAVHGASALRALPSHEFCQRSFVLGYGKHEGLGREGATSTKILTAPPSLSSHSTPSSAGASTVRALPSHEFCQRGFVLGYGKHEGLGNNLYKILTAPALALMLNRSIIVGENYIFHGPPQTPLAPPHTPAAAAAAPAPAPADHSAPAASLPFLLPPLALSTTSPPTWHAATDGEQQNSTSGTTTRVFLRLTTHHQLPLPPCSLYPLSTPSGTRPLMESNKTVGQRLWKDYLAFSPEVFSMLELRHLWYQHDCERRYRRPLVVRTDSFANRARSRTMCDDWSTWQEPIICLDDALDSVPVQTFLKNLHPAMRERAHAIMGVPWDPLDDALDSVPIQTFLKSLHPSMRERAQAVMGLPWDPHSRPNLFGEIARVLLLPTPAVADAVGWALGSGGRDADVVIHFRHGGGRRLLEAEGRGGDGGGGEAVGGDGEELGKTMMGKANGKAKKGKTKTGKTKMGRSKKGKKKAGKAGKLKSGKAKKGETKAKLRKQQDRAAAAGDEDREGNKKGGSGSKKAVSDKDKLRVVVVADHPSVVRKIGAVTSDFAKIIRFDHAKFVRRHPESPLASAKNKSLPSFRVRDWGPLPRWVALVDFFLAARARYAFISAGRSRVFTTFSQLAASLAAARSLGAKVSRDVLYVECVVSSANASAGFPACIKAQGRSRVFTTFSQLATSVAAARSLGAMALSSACPGALRLHLCRPLKGLHHLLSARHLPPFIALPPTECLPLSPTGKRRHTLPSCLAFPPTERLPLASTSKRLGQPRGPRPRLAHLFRSPLLPRAAPPVRPLPRPALCLVGCPLAVPCAGGSGEAEAVGAAGGGRRGGGGGGCGDVL